MKTPVALMLAVAATAPLTFDLAQSRRDCSVTSLTIGAGSGSYAEIARGCNGEVLSKQSFTFRDKGVAIEHAFAGPAVLGMRGTYVGYLGDAYWVNRPNWYWNPYGALEWDSGGLGVGYVFGHQDSGGLEIPPVSAHVRLGNPSRSSALAVSLFEGVPALTSGGLCTAAVAFAPMRRWEMWLGVAGGEPYDGIGYFLRTKAPLGRNFTATTTIRLGQSEGVAETGLSMALTWSAVHR